MRRDLKHMPESYATALTKRLRVGAYSMLFRDFNAHTALVGGGWIEAGFRHML